METKNKSSIKSLFRFSSFYKERDTLFENMAIMLSSGINILSVLDTLRSDLKSKENRQIIDYIYAEVDSGMPLWKAIEKTSLLSGHLISLIRIGEESGRLPQNLKIVIEQQQKDRDFKSKLKSALAYPLFVLLIMLIVGSVIMVFVLPRLSSIYTGLNVDLPLITRIFIDLGIFMDKYGLILLPSLLGVLLLTVYFVFIFKKTKVIGQNILFVTPIIKNVIKEVELARFGYVFGTLLEAGVPILASLDSLYSSSEFYHYKKFYLFLRKSIEEGLTFQQSFNKYPRINSLFPISVRNIINASEQAGNLSAVILKLGNVYEKKNELTTKNLSVLLEPILLVVIWVGVGLLAMAVILPIYSLVGNFNNVAGESEQSTVTPSTVPTTSVSPTTSITPITTTVIPTTTIVLKSVEIKSTPTKTLNVREKPSASSKLLTTVKTGEKYEYITIQNNWYQLKLKNGTTGWVSGDYVTVL